MKSKLNSFSNVVAVLFFGFGQPGYSDTFADQVVNELQAMRSVYKKPLWNLSNKSL